MKRLTVEVQEDGVVVAVMTDGIVRGDVMKLKEVAEIISKIPDPPESHPGDSMV